MGDEVELKVAGSHKPPVPVEPVSPANEKEDREVTRIFRPLQGWLNHVVLSDSLGETIAGKWN